MVRLMRCTPGEVIQNYERSYASQLTTNIRIFIPIIQPIFQKNRGCPNKGQPLVFFTYSSTTQVECSSIKLSGH